MRLTTVIALATACVAAAGPAAPAFAGTANPLNGFCRQEVAKWVRGHAVACADSKAYFRKLGETLGGEQIVAIGLPAPGTREGGALTLQLLQNLVEQQQFNLFGLQASWPSCELLDDWLETGRGDVRALLAKPEFSGWRTADIVEMLTWLRQHNSGLPPQRHVRFFGFDCRGVQDVLPNLLSFLRKTGSPTATQAEQAQLAYSLFEEYRGRSGAAGEPAPLQPGGAEDLQQRAQIILERLADVRARLERELGQTPEQQIAGLTPEERKGQLRRFLADLPIVAQSLLTEVQLGTPGAPRFGTHDRYMFENVESVIAARGASRVVLCGPAVHLSRCTHDDFGWSATDRPLGSYLAEKHRQRYYSLGLIYGQGQFLAGDRTLPLAATPEGFIEQCFDEVKHQPCFIDVRALTGTAQAAACLAHDTLMRTASGTTPVRKDDFDGWLYSATVTPSSP